MPTGTVTAVEMLFETYKLLWMHVEACGLFITIVMLCGVLGPAILESFRDLLCMQHVSVPTWVDGCSVPPKVCKTSIPSRIASMPKKGYASRHGQFETLLRKNKPKLPSKVGYI